MCCSRSGDGGGGGDGRHESPPRMVDAAWSLRARSRALPPVADAMRRATTSAPCWLTGDVFANEPRAWLLVFLVLRDAMVACFDESLVNESYEPPKTDEKRHLGLCTVSVPRTLNRAIQVPCDLWYWD